MLKKSVNKSKMTMSKDNKIKPTSNQKTIKTMMMRERTRVAMMVKFRSNDVFTYEKI